jgi:hypothetical protein
MGPIGLGEVSEGWVGLAAAAGGPDEEQEGESQSPIHVSKDRWERGLRATPKLTYGTGEWATGRPPTLMEAGLSGLPARTVRTRDRS